MVELADTPDLGSGALGVRVQVPSLAYLTGSGTGMQCFSPTNFCGNSSVVERDLAKVDVAGPTPVSRSKAIRSNLNRLFFIQILASQCRFV